MARSQKKRCDVPSFAAVPTQPEPTTNKICVRTRSPSPSGFIRATLCSSTLPSARFSSDAIVEALKWCRASCYVERSENIHDCHHSDAGRTKSEILRFAQNDKLSGRVRVFSEGPVRFEIHDVGLSHQHRRCTRRCPKSPRRTRLQQEQAVGKTLAISLEHR